MRTQYMPHLCWVLMVMIMSDCAFAQQLATAALYRKELSEGREIVLTQEPLVPVAAVTDLLPAELMANPANAPTGVFALAMEIRFVSRPPLRLWSHVIPVYRDSEYGQYAVLDLLVLPGRQILAMATPGSSIDVLQVTLEAPQRVARLRYADWSQLGASIPTRPGRLSAKLSSDKEGLIGIEVTDSLERVRQHTLFQQRLGEWQFTRLKQWQEKAPDPQGAADAERTERGR